MLQSGRALVPAIWGCGLWLVRVPYAACRTSVTRMSDWHEGCASRGTSVPVRMSDWHEGCAH